VSFEPGQTLSHYRLVERIGEGGMGVVWKAVDQRLDREIALKFIAPAIAGDPQWLARFRYEAKIVAALNHPNIVTIHAIEEVGADLFLVMELVQGATLDRVIPKGGLPLPRLLRLAVDIADAVAAAHEHGVTHRDLKPRNVIVRDDGLLKVLDFGMARTTGASPVGEDASTRTMPSFGAVEGTVAYMSPEQLRGCSPDHRSDLFSLGVVLYEMATGECPFTGGTPAEVVASILRDEPRPLPESRPGLPRQLGRIVDHALQKDVRYRFQTARDLKNELEQLGQEIRRGTPAPEIRSVAVLPLDDLSGDPAQAYFVDGMTDLLINSLARIRALRVISRTSSMRYKSRSKPLPEIARELGVEAVVEGSVLRAGGRVRITAELIDATHDRLLWADTYEHDLIDVLTLQSRVARTIAEQIEVELTPQERAYLARERSVDPAVHEAYLKGRHLWYQRTTQSVRDGLRHFEEAVRLDPSYAPAHAGIADSYIVDGGRYLGVSPQVAYTRARAAAKRAVELDDHLAEAHTSLAAVLTDYDWDWAGADREYRRAIELNPGYTTTHAWYAEHLSRMGRHDEAVAEVRLVPKLDPASVFSHMIVAWILFFARRHDEAVEEARRTLERDPDYATAHRILGWAYEERGQYDEAIACHRRASELTGHLPNFMAQLGRPYALSGRRGEALALLERLAQDSETTYVSSLDIAIIHAALGDHPTALDRLDRAYEERADHLPYAGVNPRLDSLRSEPRFQRLLDRMGLGKVESLAPPPRPR
jgi:serine/threonine-protein kinase